MLTEDYRVRLEQFEGPLDLLLYLIRKNEVEVHNIPIATIAAQYVEFLEHIASIDIDVAGEFLLMAATLTEIKSRMLSPTPTPETGEAGALGPTEDPRAELVRQLLAYKSYRDASRSLTDRFEDWQSRFPAAPAKAPERAIEEAANAELEGVDVGDLELVDLVEAFRKIMETVNFDRLGEHKVVYEDTPIELHAEDILDFMRRDSVTRGVPEGQGEIEFGRVFEGRNKPQMIGLFLALLDLVRRRVVRVRQEAIGGTIVLSMREPDVDAPPPSLEGMNPPAATPVA